MILWSKPAGMGATYPIRVQTRRAQMDGFEKAQLELLVSIKYRLGVLVVFLVIVPLILGFLLLVLS